MSRLDIKPSTQLRHRFYLYRVREWVKALPLGNNENYSNHISSFSALKEFCSNLPTSDGLKFQCLFQVGYFIFRT